MARILASLLSTSKSLGELMPLIVKRELLRKRDGLLEHDGQLFNGILVEQDDCSVTEMVKVSNGEEGETFVSLVFGNSENFISSECAGFEWLGGAEEPAQLNGEPYCGVVLFFENGICESINSFDYGWWGDFESYWPAGNINCYKYSVEGALRSGVFFESGEPKRVSITYRNKLDTRFSLDDRGRLENISISGVDQHLKSVLASIEFHHLSIDSLKQYQTSETFAIVGNLIDDDYLAQLSLISLEATKKLLISSKLVTAKGILRLKIFSNLHELELKCASVCEAQEKELASRLPNVRVSFYTSLS